MDADCRGREPVSPRTPGSEPRSPRSPYAGQGGRLRARLEASSVGLEELNLLRQNHLRAVESVKAMLMANIPEETPAEQQQESPEEARESRGVEVTDGEGAATTTTTTTNTRAVEHAPSAESTEGSRKENELKHQQRDGCRKRSSSMDIAVARSLALTAKKLAKVVQDPNGASCRRRNENSREDMHPFADQPTTWRNRSSSFSVEKHTRQEQLKKGQSMSILPGGGRQQSQSKPGGGCHHSVPDVGSQLQSSKLQDSLSGSFLSLGTLPNSAKYNRPQVDSSVEQELLTEQDFNSHFTSARSLSGSKLKYDFPSPMHAILLHYDKTNNPVLDPDVMTSDQEGKIRMRRASFSGPVGRRLSRQEVSYKLRKDSSLGELPTSGRYFELRTKPSAKSSLIDSDDGVGNFIEMLASRGLAKKRQDERDRKQRMMQALSTAHKTVEDTEYSAKKKPAIDDNEGFSSTKKANCDISTTDSDISKADSSGVDSLQSVDGDSGQWEGSTLSSSGKRGSHASIRSSTSSKASLSSEEGYYSHPGSPQNTHSNNRFSIQSSGSMASATSISFCQGDYSDEDLLESPLEKLQGCTIPESPDSAKTMTASSSNCGSVEIIDYQNSPGAKRRFSTSSLQDSRSDKLSKCSTLPRTSTPRNDITLKALSKTTFDQLPKSETVKIRITKAKSSPINGITRPKSESLDASRDFLMSPKVSFTNAFDSCLSSGSPKDNVESPGSPGLKKDSPSWGKLLPDAPRFPSWRQTSPNNDLPMSGSNRNRFECPRTPTIKEEPVMEAEFAEPPWSPPVLLPLPAAAATDSTVMLSPPICKAPKVPSWRKRNKVSATTPSENSPQLVAPAVKTSPVDFQEELKPCVDKFSFEVNPVRRQSASQIMNISKSVSDVSPVRNQSVSGVTSVKRQLVPQMANNTQSGSDVVLVQRESVSQMANITMKLTEPKDHESKTRRGSNSHLGSALLKERPENGGIHASDKLNHNMKQQKEHTTQKKEGPLIKITVAPMLLQEKKRKTVPSSPQITTTNNECSPKLIQSGEKTPIKTHLQPLPGRKYLSRTPVSDATNVFQYPTVADKASPKASSCKDIHEILKNWVEAKTPTLSPGSRDSGIQMEESHKSTTLPRGFRQPQANQVKSVTDVNSDILRRSRRMFHSQELCYKDGNQNHDTTPRLRITAVDSSKQCQLNRTGNDKACAKTVEKVEPSTNYSRPVGDGPERDKIRTVPQHKCNEHKMSESATSNPLPSPLPQPRPRSNTWSRGQQPPHLAGKTYGKNAWVREVVVPPRTPTCRAEVNIYKGRSKQNNSDNEMRQAAQPQLQWFRSCTDLKDTFV